MHNALSVHLQSPEIVLDQREAMMLATAGANVSRWYVAIDFDKDTKSSAWLALAACMLIVYGPRGMAISKRRRQTIEAEATGQAYAAGAQAEAEQTVQ